MSLRHSHIDNPIMHVMLTVEETNCFSAWDEMSKAILTLIGMKLIPR